MSFRQTLYELWQFRFVSVETAKGVFEGFRVNRVEGTTLYPLEKPSLTPGTMLYRNYDHLFEQLLQKKSARRRIAVDLLFYEIPRGFALKVTDESGCSAVVARCWEKEEARTPQDDNQKKQLSRLGDTPFEARSVVISMQEKSYFIPSSLLADLRREAIDRLVQVRQMAYRRPRRRGEAAVAYPASSLSYLGNVSNALARAFYHAHGVENIEPAYECLPVEEGALMFTRFCIKRQWGKCPREKRPAQDREGWKEPLYLQYRDTRLRLEFDCARCQMRLYRVTPSRG